jgi:hypothetical protein
MGLARITIMNTTISPDNTELNDEECSAIESVRHSHEDFLKAVGPTVKTIRPQGGHQANAMRSQTDRSANASCEHLGTPLGASHIRSTLTEMALTSENDLSCGTSAVLPFHYCNLGAVNDLPRSKYSRTSPVTFPPVLNTNRMRASFSNSVETRNVVAEYGYSETFSESPIWRKRV